MTSPNSSSDKLIGTLNLHVNELFDACALLDAAEERIESDAPNASENGAGHIRMHNTLRIVQMARERVKAAAEHLFCLEV